MRNQRNAFKGRRAWLSIAGALAAVIILGYALSSPGWAEDSRNNSTRQANETATIPRELLSPGGPLTMTDANLPGALKVYSPLVVDCWERGCRPCELIDPKINQMAADFKGKIVFAKVCIDDNPATMIKYGVKRTPTLLIFNNSTLVYRHVGNYPIDDLKNIILTVLHMR